MYHEPGHFVAMDVWLDDVNLAKNERITHGLEIRTAKDLITSRNRVGFEVSRLDTTTVIHSYSVTLPRNYRKMFSNSRSIRMYVCIMVDGQNIKIRALRPLDAVSIPDFEWLTYPEVVGTYGEASLEIYGDSFYAATPKRQRVIM